MLRAEGLCKSFGVLLIADHVSLDLPLGRRHGLIGPNGAGKTTLFNLLSGELRADAGRIFLDGSEVSRASSAARARRGLARSFQKNNLFEDLSVHENLAIACALAHGVDQVFWRRFNRFSAVHEAAEALALHLGLANVLHTRARFLAYGSQRQLEIGLALATRPKVLLLDEPTAGMSPDETRAIQALIQALPAALTVLVIEHDMDVLFGLVERVTVLDRGRVLLEGTPAEVRGSGEVRRRYLGARRA